MTPEEFSYLADFLKKESGLVVSENKGYLIESRLLPIAREQGLEDVSGLVKKMRSGAAKTQLDGGQEA